MSKKKNGKTKSKGGPGASFRAEPLSPALLERVLSEVHKPLKLDDFLRVLNVHRREKTLSKPGCTYSWKRAACSGWAEGDTPCPRP